MAESKKNFEKRVLETCKVELSLIPEGSGNDMYGHWLCKRGNTVVTLVEMDFLEWDRQGFPCEPEYFRVCKLD